MNISKRTVQMFRCYHDPMIGPKPRQAFSMVELPNWYMELTPVGVYVKCPIKDKNNKEVFQEHVVPFANIQSIKFIAEVGVENESADFKKAA